MPASLPSSPQSSQSSLMDTIPDDKGHDLTLDRPSPRRPRTPAKLLRLGVRNRRHEYLVKTPSYFDNLEHELAGMISYLIFSISLPLSADGSCRRSCSLERELTIPFQT